MSGWIKLHRKLLNHPLYQEKRIFSKFEAWIDLLLLANYQDSKVILGNEIIDVQKGSFITSDLKLMDRWEWSKTKVRSFLNLLQNENMIELKKDRKKTTINIVNYSVYQANEIEKEPQKNHEETTEEPQKDTAKKERNKELKIYSSTFEEFWNRYPRKVSKKRAFECWNARLKETDAETLIECAKNYSDYCREQKTEEHFIKHPSTFLSAKRDYEDYLIPLQPNKKEYQRPALELVRVTQEEADFLAEMARRQAERNAARNKAAGYP